MMPHASNISKAVAVALLALCHLSLANNPNLIMGPQFFYLQVTAVDCEVKCLLNGFPVYEINAEGELTNQIPVNLYLIGKNNELEVTVKPHTGKQSRVDASAYLYGASDVVSTDDAQADRKVFTVEASGEEKQGVFVFDNEKFNFANVLAGAPVIGDEKVLRAYAAELIESIRKKDVGKLLTEMQPKIRDYAASFSAPEEALKESLKGQLTEMLGNASLKKASAEDITFTPYCDGRIWALRIKPNIPFLYIKEDDSEMTLEIFVGMDGDRLKIVR